MNTLILAVAILCPPGPLGSCKVVQRPQPSIAACRDRLPGVVEQMHREFPGDVVRGRPRCDVVERSGMDVDPGAMPW